MTGRSRGGPSTRIHATCDAPGNPTGFHLTPGQACDLDGADALIGEIEADILIAELPLERHWFERQWRRI